MPFDEAPHGVATEPVGPSRVVHNGVLGEFDMALATRMRPVVLSPDSQLELLPPDGTKLDLVNAAAKRQTSDTPDRGGE